MYNLILGHLGSKRAPPEARLLYKEAGRETVVTQEQADILLEALCEAEEDGQADEAEPPFALQPQYPPELKNAGDPMWISRVPSVLM